MRTPFESIIPAIITKLRSDETLSSLVSGIFDDVPQGQPFPFIVIGEMSETPFSTFGRSGRTSSITVNILSQYKGFKEATGIYAQVNQLLDGQELTLGGYALISLRFTTSQFIKDGETRHIPAVYEVITQEDKS
jgi:hypothetical protein